MKKIDWMRKLTSRKFWCALAGFVSLMLTAFRVADTTAAQVTELLMAGGLLVAYVLAEGWTDASNAAGETKDSDEEA